MNFQKFLVIILCLFVIGNKAESCNITFQKGYLGTGTSYGVETNNISVTTPINTTAIKFTSANPDDVTFSGNNVAGTLSFSINNVDYVIIGVISRPEKIGNQHIAYYMVETTTLGGDIPTGTAYFLVIPGYESNITDNNSYSTSSDPVDNGMNAVLTSQINNNTQPIITYPNGYSVVTINVPENTKTVTTVTSSDPDAGDSFEYYVSGGVDASLFSIDSQTGVLEFNSIPDYSNPQDANLDNVYNVAVAVSDSYGASDEQAIDAEILNPTLPISLVSFSSLCEKQNVKLSWQTASEENNKLFEIQKSCDASEWSKIGIVTGAGTSNSILNYSFFDSNNSIGIYYYRLKQIDFDGGYSYSKVISVYCNEQENDNIKIYPNPAVDYFNLSLDENFIGKKFTVFDCVGKILINEIIIGNSTKVLVNDLEPGIYFIRFESKFSKPILQKILVTN